MESPASRAIVCGLLSAAVAAAQAAGPQKAKAAPSVTVLGEVQQHRVELNERTRTFLDVFFAASAKEGRAAAKDAIDSAVAGQAKGPAPK